MHSRTAILFVCVSLALALYAGRSSATASDVPLLYTLAREYSPLAWIHGGERFPQGAAIFLRDGERRSALVPGFAASADANVSFDGKTVLFAGKRGRHDHWQIWEIPAQSGEARQVTQCDDDCVRPLHVPLDRVVYAHKIAGKFVLEIASLSASKEKVLQLTYTPGNSLPLDVLRDGRVLFEAAYPLGEGAISELYTVYTDGSGIESYRCDHGDSRYSGKQVSSGAIVFTRDGSLARFTSALAHEVAISAPAGSYAGDVIEMPSGEWLVSWHSGVQKNFELWKWKPGASALQPEVTETGANVIQPALVMERATPNFHPSGLHEWSYANVLCLNAYTSKEHFEQGSIAMVRFYGRGPSGLPQMLGTAPVEKDGSFYVRVPGNQPLKIELLDESGNSLRKEAGWFWMRGGEQRICVGCHAGPEAAPENAVPAVFRRSTVPADMSSGNQRPSSGGH
jgi:hypothetical protein